MLVSTKRTRFPEGILRYVSCAVLALLMMGTAVTARAQAGLVGGMAVSTVAASIAEDLRSVIAQIESSASVTSFRVRSDLIVVADNLKVMSEELIGKTFADLTQQQKTFLENARLLASDAKSGVKLTADRVEGVLAAVPEAMARIPGIDKRPFVTKYSPSFVLEGKPAYAVQVSGSLIGNKNPSLQFSDVACTLKTKTERTLEFDCPAKVFGTSDKWRSGLLNVTEPKPWWKVWGDEKSHSYTISIRGVPQVMGKYTFRSTGVHRAPKANARSQPAQAGNGHCQGDQHPVFTFSPASGCTIDISSIAIQNPQASRNSTVGNPISVTSSGFQMQPKVGNHGVCGPREPITGNRIPVDARGSVSFTAAWNDMCPTDQNVESPVEAGDLLWTAEKLFKLAQHTSSFILEVTQADGTKRVVTGTAPTDWFDVTFDAAAKAVVLKPKSLETAMR